MSKLLATRLGLAALLPVFVVSACKKTSAPTAESLARHGPPAIDSGTAPEPIVIPDSGNVQANLDQLSLALRKYIAGSHRLPKDFNDFLLKSGVQPPQPPTGKKYIIEGQAITLADQ